MSKRRLTADEINVPSFAHDVPGGYPVYTSESMGWDLCVHIFAPHMPSPRPRVTRFGSFMPAEYRVHCQKLAASLAYARGLHEATKRPWDARAAFRVDLAFWGETQRGDLDNLAKTVMDAGQLHRGETPGAELWQNDRQIRSLLLDWIDVEDDAQWSQLVVRVRALPTRSANMPNADAEPVQERTNGEPGTVGGLERPKARQRATEAKQKPKVKKASK